VRAFTLTLREFRLGLGFVWAAAVEALVGALRALCVAFPLLLAAALRDEVAGLGLVFVFALTSLEAAWDLVLF